MSIGNMAGASSLLWALAGMFAVAAVILFFKLDIIKCWRMVSGSCPVHRKMQKPCKTAGTNQSKTEQPGTTEVLAKGEETTLLTMPFETTALEMIQDIVYLQDTTRVLPD